MAGAPCSFFMVVYPPDRENEVMTVLGDWADERWASQHALALADKEITSLTSNNLFFRHGSIKGTSHVALQEYADAATAYDKAFSLYSIWDVAKQTVLCGNHVDQTGPYFAYFYSQRYQDVINLADTTFFNQTISSPSLE